MSTLHEALPDLAVVDLSNVCGSTEITRGEPSMTRWEVLRSAWQRTMRRDQKFHLVAKSNLYASLRDGRQQFDRLREVGKLEVAADDDERILEFARDETALIISNDLYTDHLKITGLTGLKAFGWKRTDSGIVFMPRTLDRLLSAMISRRQVEQVIKDYDLTRTELSRRWVCTSPSCSRAVVTLPFREHGHLVCPDCGGWVRAGKPWSSPVWIKALFDRTVVAGDIVVEDGEELIVGRDFLADLWDAELPMNVDQYKDALETVSRNHVAIRNAEGSLEFRDLGSKNGTRTRKAGAGNKNLWLPPSPPTSQGPFTSRMRLQLGSKFQLEISGRSLHDAYRADLG